MEQDTIAAAAEPIVDDTDGEKASTAASIVDGEEHALDPASIIVVRIAALTWILGLAAANAIGLLVVALVADEARPWSLYALLPLALLAGILAVFGYWWPGVRYRYLSYRVDDIGLMIRRGVLWRSIVSVPCSRVQHTDVSQGPVQRHYGLATLVVHTAGTENASITLAGLRHPFALQIRDHLVSSDDADAV